MPDSPSRFIIASDGRQILDIVTGEPTHRSPAPASGMAYEVQAPPGLDDNGREAVQTMLGALGAAKTIEAVVRAVAGFVCDCCSQGGRLSDELEVGLTFNGAARYCHRKAAWLASASDAEIGRAFTPPPSVPAFPFLPIEQQIFRLVPTLEV